MFCLGNYRDWVRSSSIECSCYPTPYGGVELCIFTQPCLGEFYFICCAKATLPISACVYLRSRWNTIYMILQASLWKANIWCKKLQWLGGQSMPWVQNYFLLLSFFPHLICEHHKINQARNQKNYIFPKNVFLGYAVFVMEINLPTHIPTLPPRL